MAASMGGGRRTQPRAAVVLTAGWSGERQLVRLLSASGAVHCDGYWLGTPRPDPARALRSLLRADVGTAVRCVLIQPHHLWLVHKADPSRFVEDLIGDGVTVLSLERRSAQDRGLSRALCGPHSEVLPLAPQVVDAGTMATFARDAEYSTTWLDEVLPADALRLEFEDDLARRGGADQTAARVADHFSLPRWSAPVELDLPVHERLWSLVANAGELRERLVALAPHDA